MGECVLVRQHQHLPRQHCGSVGDRNLSKLPGPDLLEHGFVGSTSGDAVVDLSKGRSGQPHRTQAVLVWG